MKKKLLFVLPVVLLLVGYEGYTNFLTSKPGHAMKKIQGSLVSVGEPFTLDLANGRFARISVSLLVSKAPAPDPAAPAGTPVLPQNDAVRAIVTDLLTGVDSSTLNSSGPRHGLQAKILKTLKKSTDVPVTKVLFTDLAVQ
ncbi:MAG TPA: flagellar basal body-associated FliL family protein [Gaiellales bacterium]|jgi:flagellar FliL protein|nr:flagellar basal body-associated FliL family protein [Gaiellales bacterium]